MAVEFWSDEAEKLSKRLYLPNQLPPTPIINSWFIANEFKNPNVVNQILPFELYNPNVYDTDLISTKVRIRLSKNQKHMFRKWLVDSNRAYNYTINHIMDCRKQKIKFTDFNTLRSLYIETVEMEAPRDVVANAIRDAYKAYNSSVAVSNATNKPFKNMAPRLNNEAHQSMRFPQKSFGKKSIYSTKLKELFDKSGNKKDRKIKITESVVVDNEYVFIHDRYIGYSIAVSNPSIKPPKVAKKTEVSIDPGVRTFMTAYSNEGCYEYGCNATLRLQRLKKIADNLTKKLKKCNHKKKKKLKRVIAKARYKIKNLVKEMHNQTINHLVTNYEKIMIGDYSSQRIAKSKKSNRVVNERGYLLAHYKFRMQLIYKANQQNSSVMVCDEAYTSMTCTNCGNLNRGLKGSKVYHCPKCKLTIDRDFNGARNIMLRCLTFNMELQHAGLEHTD